MVKKKKRGMVKVNRERCKGCHLCMEVCPSARLEAEVTLNKKGYLPVRFNEEEEQDKKDCTACAQCATVCPEVAIEVYRAK